MCVRAPLLGRRGVSVRSMISGVCRSKSETISTREGMLEPAFCPLKVKNGSRSEVSASLGWKMFAGCALASCSTTSGGGGASGRSLVRRDPGEKSSRGAPSCNGFGSWVRRRSTTAAESARYPPTSSRWALETPLTPARRGSGRRQSGGYGGGCSMIVDRTEAAATTVSKHQPYTSRQGARSCHARGELSWCGRGEAAGCCITTQEPSQNSAAVDLVRLYGRHAA